MKQEDAFCIHCQQWCICDIIAKVRQDERERADGQSVILAGDCEKQITRAESDMLAKCIAVVEEIIPDDSDSGSWEATIAAAWLRHAVSKLRALEEKP